MRNAIDGVPLAQRSERRSYVPKVMGSSPIWDTPLFLGRTPHRGIGLNPAPLDVTGSWCSGITSASHAEGPGFKSQWVHFFLPKSVHMATFHSWQALLDATVWPSGLRRQTQVLVEQSAWVRTPQLSSFPLRYVGNAWKQSAHTPERWQRGSMAQR